MYCLDIITMVAKAIIRLMRVCLKTFETFGYYCNSEIIHSTIDRVTTVEVRTLLCFVNSLPIR